MIRFLKGNLFNSKAKVLVNTVNCVGIMGKGVALAFKKRFPAMYKDYRRRCEAGEIQPGVLTIYKDDTPWVINFPTKRHWKNSSRLEDIEAGLQMLVRDYPKWGITSIAMPALGCGQGGLDWAEVKPLIEKYLNDTTMEVEVFEPGSEADPFELDNLQGGEDTVIQESLFGESVVVKPSKAKRTKRKGRML
jgi:O-acetyl-ADP-ribose deacetylase (regulator of RNase III)